MLGFLQSYQGHGRLKGDRLEGAKARMMDLWLDEERRALDAGYNGLRVTGNTAFVNPADWSAFMEYEEYAEEALASQRIVALCSYLLDRRAGADVLDVVRRHSCTLDRPDESGWQVLGHDRYGLLQQPKP